MIAESYQVFWMKSFRPYLWVNWTVKNDLKNVSRLFKNRNEKAPKLRMLVIHMGALSA